MNKICNVCGVIKGLEEFYAHPDTADGRLGMCKVCKKEYARRYRIDNSDKCRIADREKHRRPKYKKLNALWCKRNKERSREIKRLWAQRNRHKRSANWTLNNAIRDGKNSRPKICQRCQRAGDIEAHHEDYSKPFEVVWLCTSCHGATRIIPF